jgi:hypothetical protein
LAVLKKSWLKVSQALHGIFVGRCKIVPLVNKHWRDAEILTPTRRICIHKFSPAASYMRWFWRVAKHAELVEVNASLWKNPGDHLSHE